MSRQANPTVVGAFIIGALVLIVTAILVFSGTVFFAPHVTVVSVFPGAVRGLSVGAAVRFRGVKVGEVSAIRLRYDRNEGQVLIPVYMKLARAQVQDLESGEDLLATFGMERLEEELQKLVDQGLRARLSLLSLVTAQVIVELDFYPDAPEQLSGVDADHVEIPTIPAPLDRLRDVFVNLPLHEIADKLITTLDGIDRLTRSEDLKQAIREASVAMKEASSLLANANQEIQPLSQSARASLQQFRTSLANLEVALARTLQSAEGLVGNVNEQVGPLSSSALSLLEETRGTIAEIDSLVASGSDTRFQLNLALKEIAAAARALRVMAEYLERHPDALLKGKGY